MTTPTTITDRDRITTVDDLESGDRVQLDPTTTNGFRAGTDGEVVEGTVLANDRVSIQGTSAGVLHDLVDTTDDEVALEYYGDVVATARVTRIQRVPDPDLPDEPSAADDAVEITSVYDVYEIEEDDNVWLSSTGEWHRITRRQVTSGGFRVPELWLDGVDGCVSYGSGDSLTRYDIHSDDKVFGIDEAYHYVVDEVADPLTEEG